MNQKEKALELGNKMYNGSVFSKTIKEHLDELQNAKRCALIAVDEIIKIIEDNCLEYDDSYWNEVKQEIEKL